MKKYKVDYILLDGTEAGKGVHTIGFSNLKFIGDAGDDKGFLDLKVDGGEGCDDCEGGMLICRATNPNTSEPEPNFSSI